MGPSSDSGPIRVIVTDAETRIGLHVIRALGKAQYRVTALSRERPPRRVLGFSSRFTSEQHRLPSGPYAQTLLDTLERLAPRHDVVIPISTESISLVAAHAHDLQKHLRFYVPSVESMQVATDKATTTRIAQAAGIPTPTTYHRMDPLTIAEWVGDSRVPFPLVVKYANDTRAEAWLPSERYRIVHTPDDLVREYRRMHHLGPYPLVQEYVDGPGCGFFCITDPSAEPVATFCHRRLREYPITGGPSTLCESITDPTLVALGTSLLRTLHWTGVAMVEFKRDRHTHEYKFLEINPRFWGSLPLALQCGVDFPVYQVELALGILPRPPHTYPTGRRMRFLFPDLRAAIDQCRAARSPSVIIRYLAELSDRSISDGLFETLDPRPTLIYILNRLAL